jgi:hypothetical protein
MGLGWLVLGACSEAGAPAFAGTFTLSGVDGGPLPAEVVPGRTVVSGSAVLRENLTFEITSRFSDETVVLVRGDLAVDVSIGAPEILAVRFVGIQGSVGEEPRPGLGPDYEGYSQIHGRLQNDSLVLPLKTGDWVYALRP